MNQVPILFKNYSTAMTRILKMSYFLLSYLFHQDQGIKNVSATKILTLHTHSQENQTEG